MIDNFAFKKNQQLIKKDKSLKNSIDEKIKTLCNKINSKENYYTTSSCSGRILLLFDSKLKRNDLFIKVWHDLINFKELKKELNKINSKKLVYFKQDPVILHASCKTLKDAQNLIDFAIKKAGWKRCGIINLRKRIVVELNSTEKLEFPIMNKRRILVNDVFLKFIVKKANKKLRSSWEKIKKLAKLVG